MAWKDMKQYRVAIWIGAAIVFFAALAWQMYTGSGKKEGFQAGPTVPAYVLSGPQMANNPFYARLDVSCNTLTDCESCGTQSPVTLHPDGTVRTGKCTWCPSTSKCMVNLPAYVTDLSANTISQTMCGNWSGVLTGSYQCERLADAAETMDLSGSSPKLPPLPPSQREQDLPTPLLPSEKQPPFPVITSPGVVQPADAGSVQKTFPAAAKPTGWDVSKGPFEEYVQTLVDSELVNQGVPVTEGFQSMGQWTLSAVLSNVEQLLQGRRK